MWGEYKEKPKPMVWHTTHRKVQIGNQWVDQHLHEWISADDPRVGKPGELIGFTGPVLDEPTTGNAANDAPASPAEPQALPPAEIETEDAVAISAERSGAVTTAIKPVSGSPIMDPEPLPISEIPKKEPRKEVIVNSDFAYETEPDEEEDGQEDVPEPITEDDLKNVDNMSPEELEGLIGHVEWHEELQGLRERARERVGTWLEAVKKAAAAPRCEFVKT